MKAIPLLGALALLGASIGCGGADASTASVTAPPPASATPSPAAVASASGRRSPPDSILKYWTFDAKTHLVLYADVGGLLHTELGRAVVPAVLQLTKANMSPEQQQCVERAADTVHDFAAGIDDEAGLFIVRVDDGGFPLKACMTAAGGAPATVPGVSEAFQAGGALVAHAPGVLLVGPRKYVENALQPRSAPGAFPASVSLGPDEYAAFHVVAEEGIEGSGSLLASSERFRLRVEGDLPPPLAKHVEREWDARKNQATGLDVGGQEAAALLQKIVGAIELRRDGGHLQATFDLHEPPTDQARDLGAVAGLATFAVRRYIADAKAAEARNAVGQIARDYVAWYEREDATPRARKKLFSLPPVPKAIPSGVKYQTTPAEWKPWAAIQFEMDAPQYYQYEVRASKDGSSADVIARGDLDGDGKASEFRLHLTLDRKQHTLAVDPNVAETDPLE